MNLGRIFANAIARRVAYVVVGFVLLALSQLFGAGEAKAQNGEPGGPYPSRPSAYQACMAYRPDAGFPGWITRTGDNICSWDGSFQYFCSVPISGGSLPTRPCGTFYYAAECPNGGEWNEDTKTCFACDANAAPLSGGHLSCGSGNANDCPISACSSGCTFVDPGNSSTVFGVTIDGLFWIEVIGWTPNGQSCSVGPESPSPGTPPPDSDGDGTSDANDPSPNNPGEGGGGGEDGEQQGQDGSKACGGSGQPECAEDGSNEGSGKGNTSGGGGNCQTPPSSTGDAILAQIAYQTWATRCAVEGQGQGGTATGPGDGAKEGTLKGIKDFLDGNGQSLDEPADPWMDGDGITESDWNMGLGGGSCPAPVSTTISLAGVSQSIDFSFQPLCDLAGLLNVLFKALGAFIAAYIIAGVRR